MREKMLSVQEVCGRLDISVSTLRRWDKEGKLKSVRTDGGHRRYYAEDVEYFVRKRDGYTYNDLYAHLDAAENIAIAVRYDGCEKIKCIKDSVKKIAFEEYSKSIDKLRKQ